MYPSTKFILMVVMVLTLTILIKGWNHQYEKIEWRIKLKIALSTQLHGWDSAMPSVRYLNMRGERIFQIKLILSER